MKAFKFARRYAISEKLQMRPVDKSKLSEKQLLILQSEMLMRRKSTLLAYVLFFLPIGFFGGHHWYLRNLGRSLVYPCCGIAWIAGLFIIGFSSNDRAQNTATAVATAGYIAYLLVLLFDAVTLSWQVSKANRRIECDILQSMLDPDANSENAEMRVEPH